MCLTLPWSMRHWFGTEHERAATRPTLIVHHLFVVIAELVYLLTQTSPWHGGLSFVLFEFSNLFLMPHHLMTQLNYRGKAHFWNGIGFFVSCTLVRVAACTILGGYYIRDVVSFRPPAQLGAGVWVCVCLSLVSFWIILLLSWYWYIHDVLGEVHKEFQMAFGHDYWKFWSRCFGTRKKPPTTVSSSASRVERDQNAF